MTTAISETRWSVAQQAEHTYWDHLRSDGDEFTRILAEKTAFAGWVLRELPHDIPDGDCLEIGIGPLGIGCVHLLPGKRAIVGLDPLPPLDPASLELTAPLIAAAQACRDLDYVHLQGVGENTGLESDRFGLAISYNVLDHVRDPAAVLREAHRVLRPGGIFALGCDTVSLLSLTKYELYGRRRASGTLGGRAHPFRFRARSLLELVEQTGLHLVSVHRRGWLGELAGHAHRLLILGKKVERASAVGGWQA